MGSKTKKRRRNTKASKQKALAAQCPSQREVEECLDRGEAQTTLRLAKQLFQSDPSTASERLLAQAYAKRILELRQRRLSTDADQLVRVAMGKCPGHKALIHEAAHARVCETYSFPLNKEDVASLAAKVSNEATQETDRGEALEVLRNGLADPRMLAECSQLSDGHDLKREARIVAETLEAVASPIPPQTRDQWLQELSTVSRRSPLAPWCLFIRALEAFHRRNDDKAKELLAQLPKSGAVSRGAAILAASLNGHDRPERLTSRPTRELWRALNAPSPRQRWKTACAASTSRHPHCQKESQKRIDALREFFRIPELSSPWHLRAAIGSILDEAMVSGPPDKTLLGELNRQMVRRFGPPGQDYLDVDILLRYAQINPHGGATQLEEIIIESRSDLDDKERAMILARAAELLMESECSPFDRTFFEDSFEDSFEDAFEDHWLRLVQGAIALDRQPEYFHQLVTGLDSIPKKTKCAKKAIAETLQDWHRSFPEDIRPLVALARKAESDGSFQKALKFVATAEAIDPHHDEVRNYRLRLAWKNASRHLKTGQLHLIEKDLSALDRLNLSPFRTVLLKSLQDGVDLIRRKLGPEDVADPTLCSLLLGHFEVPSELGECQELLPRPKFASTATLETLCDLIEELDGLDDGFRAPARSLAELPEAIHTLPDPKNELLMRLANHGLKRLGAQVTVTATGCALRERREPLHEFLYLRARALVEANPIQYRERIGSCLRAAATLAKKNGDGSSLATISKLYVHKMGLISSLISEPSLDEMVLQLEVSAPQIKRIIKKELRNNQLKQKTERRRSKRTPRRNRPAGPMPEKTPSPEQEHEQGVLIPDLFATDDDSQGTKDD